MSLLLVRISSLSHAKWLICPNSITIADLRKRYTRRLALLINPIIIFLYDSNSSNSPCIIPEENTQLSEFPCEGNVLRLSVCFRFPCKSLIQIECKTNIGLTFPMDVNPNYTLWQLSELIFKKFPEWNDVDDIEFRNSNEDAEDMSKKIYHLVLEYRKLELNVFLISDLRDIKIHSCCGANHEKVMEFAISCGIAKQWEVSNNEKSIEEAPTVVIEENIGSNPDDFIDYLYLENAA